MVEGWDIVEKIYKRATEQFGLPPEPSFFLGIDTAVQVLGDPQNVDLLQQLVDYCDEARR